MASDLRNKIPNHYRQGNLEKFNIIVSGIPADGPAQTSSGTSEGTMMRIENTNNRDSKVHGANMEPTWVLSAPDGPHVGPMNLAIREEWNITLQITNVYNLPVATREDSCLIELATNDDYWRKCDSTLSNTNVHISNSRNMYLDNHTMMYFHRQY